MHRFARLASPSRSRSVRAARVSATLPVLHTQGCVGPHKLPHKHRSRRPNVLVSGLCAYGRRRATRLYLVAGGLPPFHHLRPPQHQTRWS
jgi:hypothetical protein